MDPDYLSPHDVKSDVSDQRLDHMFDQCKNPGVSLFEPDVDNQQHLEQDDGIIQEKKRLSKATVIRSDDCSEETKSVITRAIIENNTAGKLAIQFCNTDMSSKKSASAQRLKDSDKLSISSSNTPKYKTPVKTSTFLNVFEAFNE